MANGSHIATKLELFLYLTAHAPTPSPKGQKYTRVGSYGEFEIVIQTFRPSHPNFGSGGVKKSEIRSQSVGPSRV